MSERRQLSLNFFIYPDGHHEAAWRHKEFGRRSHSRRHLLSGAGAARRSAQIRRGVLRRRSGAVGQCALRPAVPARADHPAHRDRFRHQTDRPDRDRVDHLHRALQSGAAVRLAGSHQRRPGRLEHRDHEHAAGGAEFRPARASSASRTLRAGAGISRRHHAALGQLGRRRADQRPRLGCIRRHRQDPRDRSHRKTFSRARAAQHLADAAGTAGLCAGRLVRRRTRLCGAFRGSDLHRASDAGERPGILCGYQASGERLRPQPRSDQDPARHQPVHRQHAESRPTGCRTNSTI